MSMQFAYWVPNVSGGLVISNIPQKTGWSFEDNARYAKIAEDVGFDYALLQTRFMASYGAENQLEAIALASALAVVTDRLKLIAAILPGLWHPGPVAKAITTIDHISKGRAAVNIVSGWFKGEFQGFGEPWLDHNERYRRSEEFIRVLKELWTQEKANHQGDFYRIHEAPHKPKPVSLPPVFQGGNSAAARDMAARVSDWYFMNGNNIEGFRTQIEDVTGRAASYNRKLHFGVNAFVIVRDTEEEALEVLRQIILHAAPEAVEGFRSQVQFAGKASPEQEGMWANSNFDDLVQYNDGFKTGLIGTPEQVADRIIALKKVGVNLILTGFLHYDEDIRAFGEKVIPLVREKEAALSRVAAT
ncbi:MULTISPECIES: dimethylsulfone monooxygenase SfnG [Paenibacillus]|uniref:FMNH2-dependent dimethyl sulfone monooxygenase n=1 Tax=Paenibacillus pabuli TaxID=1472 RepID=A0A855XY36_9BACL|nr:MULTISPECIES: dimethyl sulfone monooxygenase SfnG [Paenibacillus]PWW43252.1 FMNH2-dependent dimethyl sulfone monooxygenase [Paenibacillus pabuli]PXW09158.1 FMNH2-dependent dimethyl sulfone monooxygenase [Paenibacillus taichungensis]